ncbi:hypothetical protein [Sinorhizobium sp. BJ1]|uniref:hypothetical protein n=1 Tax=Sinorhizobium sp. BJ1 TaxID=2035455 RepID=UPI0015CF7E82|nr:hypothetical protein [Sinorhizobium sp. BJ1]
MTERPKPLAIAATYCDALASVHNSMHGTNEDVAVGLMLFFDTIHKRDPRMMPIVIAA